MAKDAVDPVAAAVMFAQQVFMIEATLAMAKLSGSDPQAWARQFVESLYKRLDFHETLEPEGDPSGIHDDVRQTFDILASVVNRTLGGSK